MNADSDSYGFRQVNAIRIPLQAALARGRGTRASRHSPLRVWAAGAALLALAGLSGCATTSPYNQEFVELRTPNFVVTSSLGEEATLELARNLEFFHAGVLNALGLEEVESTGPPTEVVAFDDRSLERPFAVRGEPSEILPSEDGLTWMLRAGRSFDERASTDLRHRYAHRVLRDRMRDELPLWYEEGVSQLASSVEETTNGVRIGGMVSGHREKLLDWRLSNLAAKMRISDVSEESDTERGLFEAQTWAIAHMLQFGNDGARARRTRLDRYREALASGQAAARERALEVAIGGSEEAFTERLYAHLEMRKMSVSLVRVRGWDASQLELRPLSAAESRTRLAELALQLERPELAREYFERALREDPNHAVALAGRALALALEGQVQDSAAAIERALASDLERLSSRRYLGFAMLEGVRGSDSERIRQDGLAAARAQFASCLEDSPRDVPARIGMGASFLIEGADRADRVSQAERAMEWFDAARALRPGSLEIELWRARAELAQGRSGAARVRASNIVSRTHSRGLEAQARSLIEQARGGGLSASSR